MHTYFLKDQNSFITMQHIFSVCCTLYFLHTSATSVSTIRIDGDQLVIGENTIRLTITGESGAERVVILTVNRIAGERVVKKDVFIGANNIIELLKNLLCLTASKPLSKLFLVYVVYGHAGIFMQDPNYAMQLHMYIYVHIWLSTSLIYSFHVHQLCTAVYLHVNCSAVPDGDDVAVSCATVGNSEQISSIRYSINGGTTRTGEELYNFLCIAFELLLHFLL